MELVCIPPGLVHEFYPKVAPMLRAAIRKTDLARASDLDDQILRGEGLLWLAIEGQTIEAAATTTILETDRHSVCLVTACAGDDMPQWLPLFRQIEDWARFEGCKRVRIIGRRGWLRALDGYSEKYAIIEKAL